VTKFFSEREVEHVMIKVDAHSRWRKKFCQIVKTRTILRGVWQLAQKYNSSKSKVGRPGKKKDIGNW
jgi:hypothetical protein